MRILSTRKILISGLAALSLVLSGCLTDSKEEGAPVITSHPASLTAAIGDSISFSVTATGKAPLSYQWIVTPSGGSPDTLSDSTSVLVGMVDDAGFDGASLVCVVSNSEGSVTSNAAVLTINFAWQADTVLTVGAQGHLTLGTAIDLDGKRVMLSAVVNDTANGNANLRSVDLLFVYAGGSAKLMSPVAAKADSIPLALNYNDSLITDVKMVKVSTEPSNWNAGKAAFEAGTQVNSSAVVAGDMFVVMTNETKLVLVTVGTVNNATANTASTDLTVNLREM